MKFKVLVFQGSMKKAVIENRIIQERFLFRDTRILDSNNFDPLVDIVLLPEHYTMEIIEEISKKNFAEDIHIRSSYLKNLRLCKLITIEIK